MTAAVKVLEYLRARVANRANLQSHQVPVKLVIGRAALTLLSDAAGWRLAHGGQELHALFGVPIEPSDDFYARWQLFNDAGVIIAQGVVDIP